MKVNSNKKQIKDRLVYLTLFIDKVACFGIAAQSLSATNFFYDSFSNKNNGNWPKNVKDSYISYLNSAFSIGAFLGPFITIIFGRSNTKNLYILIKLVFIGGTCGFCVSNHIAVMTISKFFLGVSYMSMHIIIFWYECHNLLPEHRQRAFNLNSTLGATCILTLSTLSYLDPGNWWFWRACHLIFALLLVLSILIELTVLKKINCVSFFTQNGKYSKAEECLLHYIEEETTNRMILLEKEDLMNEDLENTRNDEDETVPCMERLRSISSLFVEDLGQNKKDVAYIVFIYVLLAGSFYDVIFAMSTYLGAKEMNNISAVKETKKWVSMGLIGKLMFASFLSYVVPNKRRKLVLELTHTIGLCLMLGISVSYLVEKLFISNICIFLFLTTSACWYPTYLVYANDILKPSLSSIAYIVNSLIDSGLFYILPNYLQFELRTKKEVGIRLLVLFFVRVVFNIMLRIWLVETYDPTRSAKYSVLVEEEIEIGL